MSTLRIVGQGARNATKSANDQIAKTTTRSCPGTCRVLENRRVGSPQAFQQALRLCLECVERRSRSEPLPERQDVTLVGRRPILYPGQFLVNRLRLAARIRRATHRSAELVCCLERFAATEGHADSRWFWHLLTEFTDDAEEGDDTLKGARQ